MVSTKNRDGHHINFLDCVLLCEMIFFKPVLCDTSGISKNSDCVFAIFQMGMCDANWDAQFWKTIVMSYFLVDIVIFDFWNYLDYIEITAI